MLNHDFEFLQMLTRNDLTEYLPDRTGKTQEFRGTVVVGTPLM